MFVDGNINVIASNARKRTSDLYHMSSPPKPKPPKAEPTKDELKGDQRYKGGTLSALGADMSEEEQIREMQKRLGVSGSTGQVRITSQLFIGLILTHRAESLIWLAVAATAESPPLLLLLSHLHCYSC